MSLPVSSSEPNRLESALKGFETAENQTIRSALEAIRNSSVFSSMPPIQVSGPIASNPLIANLFEAIHASQDSTLEWVQEQGFESVQELVEKRLEHYRWNHIEAALTLDPTYDVLSSLILAKPIVKKVPALTIPSDEAVDRLADSFIRDKLAGEESGEGSLQEEFIYFSEKVEKRFEDLIKQNQDIDKKEAHKLLQVRDLLDAVQKRMDSGSLSEDFIQASQISLNRLLSQKDESLLPLIQLPMEEQIQRLSELKENFGKKIESTRQEREKRNEELHQMQGEFQKLKKRIDTYPKAELFSENEQERKEQYYKFGLRLGVAFAGLLAQESEDLLFQRISEFLDTCFKGWDEHTLQLMAMGSNEPIYLNPQLEAWKISCLMRRSIVEKALSASFKETENDVHYQNAARYAMNSPLHLGFSKEELGDPEPLIISLVATTVRQKAESLLTEKGTDELTEQFVSRYKEIASEEEKKGVFAETLNQYEELVKQDPSFLIDPLEEIEPVFNRFASSGTLEALKELRTSLQEKNITFFSTKLSCEKKMEEIQTKHPRFFAKFKKEIQEGISKDNKQTLFAYIKTLPAQEQKSLQEMITSLEELTSKEQMVKELKEMQKFSFENIRALYNRDLLEGKFNNEELFGASAWAIGAKVLRLSNDHKDDLNTRILQWIQRLPFSTNQNKQIFKILSLSAEKLEEGEIKQALQTCLASQNLSSLLDLQTRPPSYNSLEEVLCLGNAEDLKRWKRDFPIPHEDLMAALEIVETRGDHPLLQELLQGQNLSQEDRRMFLKVVARMGDLLLLRELLRGQNLSQEDRGKLFIEAASKGRLKILDELLKNGKAISKDDRDKAFIKAASGGHLEVLRKLSKARTGGYLEWARERLTKDSMLSEKTRNKAFVGAASGGHLEVVRELLASGSEIPIFYRMDAFVGAASGGHLEVVRELLARGWEIPESFRQTAFEKAAKGGHLEVIRELFARG